MKSSTALAVLASAALSAAQSSTAVASSAAAAPTEVTECHLHGETPYCFAGEDEWELESDVGTLADAYTDCHAHDDGELHCDTPEEVTLLAATAESEESHSTSSPNATSTAIADITEVTGCHPHDDTLFCFVGNMPLPFASSGKAT